MANESTSPLSGVRFGSSWLSWVGAVTGCLRSLGITCDAADVAGQSGYAFRLTIAKDVCVSGPTLFAWESLLPGAWRLGRSTILYHAPQAHDSKATNDRTRQQCRVAFDLAKREIEAGRPCVINGAYVPEFAIVTGIDADNYQVETFKRMLNQPQPPVKFDEIEAPGGAYVLGFPTPLEYPKIKADRESLLHAIEIMNEPSCALYSCGGSAYDRWIDAMDSKSTLWWDNAYNAHCWADARRLAATFVDRLAGRNESVKPLRDAHASLSSCANALEQVASLFPFPPTMKDAPDEKTRHDAADSLKRAKRSDADALKHLTTANNAWPLL